MPMQKPSRLLPDDSHHLMATDCVLPQVALWGKGMVCALKRTSGLNGWISNQKHISLQSVALREGSRGFEEVLGTGCANCRALYSAVEQVVNELGLKADLVKEEDLMKIMEYNVMSLPALVVDGKVVAKGRITKDEIRTILTK